MIRNLLYTILFIMLISGSAKAQAYTGVWHGLITGDELINQSQYTLNVKTQQGNIITGRAYLYSNFLYVFYGIFDFIGTLDKNNVKITELKLLKSEMPDTKGLCIKYSNLLYSSNDTAQYLTGRWDNTKGNCPIGEVYLKKVVPGKKTNVSVPAAVAAKISEDKSNEIHFFETVLTQPVVVSVKNATLTIEIRDYLKADNDTVSVYLNREPIIQHLKITKKTYKKTIRLDKLSGLNEIVVYAHNLGLIPPNTCMLTVDDGVKKQMVNIQSSMQTSAAIYLKYDPYIKK